MKSFLPFKINPIKFHDWVLHSHILVFGALQYVIFVEIGPLLQWNMSFYGLYALMLLGFGIFWIYARSIHRAYQKATASQSKTNLAEAALQAKLKTLSRKEKEVLQLILQNKSNKAICELLFIEQSTLKSHINHIYQKMEVSKRQEIMALFG
ncbi:response regulator transcription factor [Pararhodonellum marinum]|uniref:response regulator transcription factor n=1 Tax=Pararhodonellum marinum TaxID=2755358 RepID=UPI0018909408|nr:helix-turn-helix transcriptional regulator [Pararhodonellum marinum]